MTLEGLAREPAQREQVEKSEVPHVETNFERATNPFARIVIWGVERIWTSKLHKLRTKDARLNEAQKEFRNDTLSDILAEEGRRCGVEHVTIPSSESIFIVDTASLTDVFKSKREKQAEDLMPSMKAPPPAALAGFGRFAAVDASRVLDAAKAHGVAVSTVLSHLLIHEQIHNAAFLKQPNSVFGQSELQSGVSVMPEGSGDVLFVLLNEGVTELEARRVYKEYATRTGHAGDAQRYIDILEKGDIYQEAVTFVRMLSRFLGEEWGVPEDVVEQGFIRAAFRGLRFDRGPMAEALVDLFGPGFMRHIGTLKNSDKIKSLFEKWRTNVIVHAALAGGNMQEAFKRGKAIARLQELMNETTHERTQEGTQT